ncbi:MAG: GGDEF domain-containing protein [Myxococcota bacterium]|nr:GGDEF domain-containing protein [Myxococcales bacterium]
MADGAEERGADERTTVVVGFSRPTSESEGAGCLVQIFGEGLGRKVALEPGRAVVGRDGENDVVIPLDSISRRHCAIRTAGDRTEIEDLGSTNGTFVNDHRLAPGARAELRTGDLVQLGAVIFKFLFGNDLEALYHEEIYLSSVVDGLTQIYNRRYFDEHLDREMARAHRHARPLALLLLDVDHFKEINDRHGHLAGDHVLVALAKRIRESVRREDCCARYGGEEIAIASPETSLAQAVVFAEKLRGCVEACDLRFDGASIPVTVSIGVAALTPDMDHPRDLVGAADARLYEAKRGGRNRVCS